MGQEGGGKQEKHAHFLKSRDGNGTLLTKPSPDERDQKFLEALPWLSSPSPSAEILIHSKSVLGPTYFLERGLF